MFGDWGWIDRRSAAQGHRQDAWLSAVMRPIVVELGYGTTIPSVRHFSQRVIHQFGGRLFRINTKECDVPTRLDVGLRMGAADGLASIAKALGDEWGSPASGGGDGWR